MKKQEILAHIDHTQVKPFCTWEDIRTLCEEALEYQTASVCVPPILTELNSLMEIKSISAQ